MEFFQQLISSLRWQDVLDILINSYILFRLYILLRGTNVIRMVVLIGMLWLLKRLAMGLGMIVTSWAIQAIIAVAALIIIIVFRNEIAGVFKTRSIASFFWGIPKRHGQTPVDIISESIAELASRKLGALIVIPQHKEIDDVVHGGIVWDGKLSKEMLVSIFWHGTPVHDGAIVIQGDRVVEVSTILPLSKDTDLPSHYGTRHRAAAGMSEQTDALVIVVSEERGEISVFKDKKSSTFKDGAELNRYLLEHIGSATDEKGKKRERFELSIAGILCLTVIGSIWFSFSRGLETLVTLEVPVEFTNRNPELEIFSATESNVKLQLSGSSSLIRNINPAQIGVKINLQNATPGDNEISINRDGILLPPGIDLKHVSPQTISVNIDRPGRRKLPVQPNWTGTLPAGLIIQKASVTPNEVEVEGGERMLGKIKAIYTNPIPVSEIKEDGSVKVGLMLLPSSLELVDSSLQNVEVHYQTEGRPQEK